MFVNSCLIKVCFCMNETCIFVSVCSMSLLFLFSFRVHLKIATDFLCSVQYCQRLLMCWKKDWKKERKGFRVLTSLNRTVVSQELWKRLGHWNYRRPLTSWRQHLSLHVKTVLFHCLWVTYTFHFIIRCNKNILFQGHFFLSVLISLCQTDRRRQREGGA